ncbi:MAG: hypothetical protein PHN84_08080 [Desulfuromonadaceae bacterium]|nr:hypothetical protein [Desulfuromonadaceae bacterium]MDD2856738.1 hypothetical protein [Desulfuromonadaceae bacterium]
MREIYRSGLIAAIIFSLLSGTLLTGCKTVQEYMIADGYRELRGDELKKLVIGNSVESSTGWKDNFKADGIFTGNSPRYSYKGSWSFSEDGQLCIIKNHPYVPNGCTMVFKNDKTGDIVWYEADNNSYNVKIITDKSTP